MVLAPSVAGLFKWRQFEPEVIRLAIGWYLHFSLSYRDVAGARRFAALTKLAKDKAISKTFGVPCRVIDSEASTESSLAENIIRQNMHPADQFEAFRRLVDEGTGVEEVAARFGVTATFVRQRLKLANVAPRFIELYREEKITLEQLMALAITDDHSAQENV